MPTLYVSQFLGHANLTTTTRYLNSTRRGLHWAMERFEAAREEQATEAEAAKKKAARRRKKAAEEKPSAVAQTLHTATVRPTQTSDMPTRRSQPKSLVS